MRLIRALIGIVVLLGVVAPARAHDASLSGVRILHREADVVVSVQTHISRLRATTDLGQPRLTDAQLDDAIWKRLKMRVDGEPLAQSKPTIITDHPNDLVTWQVTLTGSHTKFELMERIFPEDTASRTVLIDVRNGVAHNEILLDAEHPSFIEKRPPTRVETLVQYLKEGVEHILQGYDHVAFVLGLILLGGTLKSLIKTVTAFTVAHSITLSLAATGVYAPSARWIEPLIALSIVVVASENLRSSGPDAEGVARRDRRPMYAFCFGLIHGFGFAGALAEVGLPREALGVALAAFNVGVELGQATIVLLVLPVLAMIAVRAPKVSRRITAIGSIGIGVMGAYWFFTRILG